VFHLEIRLDVLINAYQHDTIHAISVNHSSSRSLSLVYLGPTPFQLTGHLSINI